MQALAERLEEFAAGRALEKADLLSFSSLKTFSPQVEDLYGQTLEAITRRAKYLVWSFAGGTRIVVHLSQAGRVDVESPPKGTRPRGSVVRFTFSGAVARRNGTGDPRARVRNAAQGIVVGIGLRVTMGRWRGSAPSPTRPPSPSSSAPARVRAACTAIFAIRRWYPESDAVGATTSCTGPGSRPSHRWARSTPKSGNAFSPRPHRCSMRPSPSNAPARGAFRRRSWVVALLCTGGSASPARRRDVGMRCAACRSSPMR